MMHSKYWHNQFSLKRSIEVTLLFLAAVMLGKGVLVATAGITLGGFARLLVLPFACLGLLAVIKTTDIKSLIATSPFLVFRPKVFLSIFMISLIAGYAVIRFGYIGAFYFPVGVFIVALFITSIVLAMTSDTIWSFLLFLLMVPFLHFLEVDLRLELFNPNPELYYLPIYPSMVALWVFSSSVWLKNHFIIRKFKKVSSDAYLIFIFLALLFSSSLLSPEPIKSLVSFWQILTWSLCFYLVANYIRTTKEMKTFIWSFIWFAWVSSFILFYFSWQDKGYQFVSLFQSRKVIFAHSIAIFTVVLVPLSASLILTEANDRKTYLWRAVLLVFIIVSMIFMATFQQSRKIYVALAATLPTMLLYKGRKIKVFVAFVVLISLVFLVGLWFRISVIFSRFSSWVSLESFMHDQSMRIDALRAGLDVIKDHPLLGIGFRMWQDQVQHYATVFYYEGLTRIYIPSAHNFFLNIGASAGIPAMLVLLFIVFRYIAKLWRLCHKLSSTTQLLAVGSFGGLVGFIVLGNLGSLMFDKHYGAGIVFWCLIGLAFALWRITTRHYEKEDIVN